MSTVERMQSEIAKLPPEEFRQLADWIEERRAAEWDRQIEEDANSGKLDRLYERLQRENAGEAEVPLNDFLDDEKLS